MKRANFSKEVKDKALTRAGSGESTSAIAKDLGISLSTLYNWTKSPKAKRTFASKTKTKASVAATPATKVPQELRLALLERDFWKSVALKGL